MISTYLLCLVVGCDRVGSVMAVAVAMEAIFTAVAGLCQGFFFCLILLLLRW